MNQYKAGRLTLICEPAHYSFTMNTLLIALLLFFSAPLPVPHVSQFGPTANENINDCSCALTVQLLYAYTGEVVTVDQCCRELGCPHVVSAIKPWLGSHGVPMVESTSTRREYEMWLIEQRHPFVTIIKVGSTFHVLLVVGFAPDGAWVHNSVGQSGPELWDYENFDTVRWHPRTGANYVMYPLAPLPDLRLPPWPMAGGNPDVTPVVTKCDEVCHIQMLRLVE